MAEDYRSYAEGAASRNPESGLGVHLRGRRLQPGADAESAGQPGWCRMSQGRSVPARGQNEPQIETLMHFQGSVAKTVGWRNPPRRASRVTSFTAQSKDLIEEQDPSQHIPLGQPPYLTFPDHVHYLVSLDRPPGAVKGSEPLAGVDPSFDRSMILFHDVVQVRTATAATPTS